VQISENPAFRYRSISLLRGDHRWSAKYLAMFGQGFSPDAE